ncbi:hypothetical protein HGRIS_005314 [Hohenbuehelia grisea]|uniref:Uncharacterized protein n=1 Tax=Hohenbuehelia grisea TaxID=104357 RepID=A0ABR3JF49_9AGAR
MSTNAASSLSTMLKPYPTEATLRIRSNSIAFFFLVLFTQLLPIPSLFTASRVALSVFRKDQLMIRGSEPGMSWKEEYGQVYVGGETESNLGLYELFCMLETAFFFILSFNISQSLYALRFPRRPLSPSRSLPPRPQARITAASPAARDKKKKLFEALSPQASPQPQRPFRTPNGASTLTQSSGGFGRSAGASALDGSQASGFSLSGASLATPSKLPMNFSLGSPPDLNSSFGSSTFGTPSPLTAYKWRHLNGPGRMFRLSNQSISCV